SATEVLWRIGFGPLPNTKQPWFTGCPLLGTALKRFQGSIQAVFEAFGKGKRCLSLAPGTPLTANGIRREVAKYAKKDNCVTPRRHGSNGATSHPNTDVS